MATNVRRLDRVEDEPLGPDASVMVSHLTLRRAVTAMGNALAVVDGADNESFAVRRDLLAAILTIEDDVMLVNGQLSPEIEDWLRRAED